jgi:hypothetical protein
LPSRKPLSKFEGLYPVMSRALSLSFCFLSCGEGNGGEKTERVSARAKRDEIVENEIVETSFARAS